MKRLRLKDFDYRYLVCGFITFCFILCSLFVFKNAFNRVIESFKDFGLSIAYYFSELFGLGDITPTVMELSSVSYKMPFGLPSTWDEFKISASSYWTRWISKSNFNGYLSFLGNIARILVQVLLVLIPIIVLLFFIFKRYLSSKNNDYNKDSRFLISFKNFENKIVLKIKLWFKSLFIFIKDHKAFYISWLWIWTFNFNFITIFIEFLAFFFFFSISFDFSCILRQIYKLLLDLSPMVSFIPLPLWLIVGFILFDKSRKKIAQRKLNHFERQNRGFINSRPLVVMVCATMGKKKTTMMTDMALSQDIMLRDKAFERILENDLKFPFFPWCNLENALKKAMAEHIVYNLATVRNYILKLKNYYLLSIIYPEYAKSIRRYVNKVYGFKFNNLIFDYDFKSYGLTYNDNLKMVDIWDVIETYSQLYFIYVIQSSYIQSNYSIRTDILISDLGNFPLWDSDFFKRDTRLMDSFSRHSHILDFDMLRLGRKVVEENEKANAFEFGVIVITEIGKERGNNLELQEKKKKDENTNQKNDLFNYTLKMIRHSATVDNFPFVRVITDDQRPQSWGADARDLSDIIFIKDSGEVNLAMPFFSLTELLYQWVFGKFADLYYRYRYVRSDNTLPMYLLKKFVSKINHYYNGIYNKFGFCRLLVQIESGTMDGQISEHNYFLMNKKIYSRRFSTDCFSDFFMAKSLRSKLGLDDLKEFSGEKATLEELMSENAYFMNDILLGLKNDEKE